jgi:hypothetical protein
VAGSNVLAFAKCICENLASLEDTKHYVAIYVGETMMTFSEQMKFTNAPCSFLNVFPATHQFKFCQVFKGTHKDLIKFAT